MNAVPDREPSLDDDAQTLQRLGYQQELQRSMGAFSNFALSLSIICILAGGITSFHIGLCSVGGAALGLGWPLACLFSLLVALSMGQLASAFPTAGGLYHWASILGGRGWGWFTAWLNLAGLIAVLAAINVGTYQFFASSLGPALGLSTAHPLLTQTVAVALLTASQALLNHRGIRTTTRLTDFSGYWILLVAVLLATALLIAAPRLEPGRLLRFDNFSGVPADGSVWPRTENVAWLFLLGLLWPAYTLTGFDGSAHTAEETVGATANVPRGIVRSVVVSGVFGWGLLAAVVMAAPDLAAAARQKEGAFTWIVDGVLRRELALALYAGIVVAQYLCGLATVTSASRMTFAFARDGGLPFSAALRRVSPAHRTPAAAIWVVAVLAVAFTVYTPVYDTLTAAAALLLYLSYVAPTALGLFAHGRSWKQMGPWDLGRCYRPLAALCVLGCGVLFVIATWPPNQQVLGVVLGTGLLLALAWWGGVRRHFRGPPHLLPQHKPAALDNVGPGEKAI